MLGDDLSYLNFWQADLILLDNIIKLPWLQSYAYLSKGLSEHSLDFVIHPFYCLLVSILHYHLMHTIHLLDKALLYLGAQRLRSVLLSLYLYLPGFGLTSDLVIELLLTTVLLLGGIGHRIVHIINDALMILLLDFLICGGRCWLVSDGSR